MQPATTTSTPPILSRLASSTDANDLDQAAALYRGEFLPGFSLAGCPAFEEWLLLTRERFAHLALTALDALTRAQLAGGRYPEAAQHARRQLALDPWREEAHRQLMRALAASGDRAAALAAYARCRQVLHDELGVEPDDETRALYEQIRNNELSIEHKALKVAERPAAQEARQPEDTRSQRRVSGVSSDCLSPAHPLQPGARSPTSARSMAGRPKRRRCNSGSSTTAVAWSLCWAWAAWARPRWPPASCGPWPRTSRS